MNLEESPTSKKRVLASRLRQERERHGWSQSELAERLGTNQVNVSRWEKGSTMPGPYFRQRLGEVFGKSLEDLGLITGTEEERSEDTGPLRTNSSALALNTIPYHRNAFFTGREDILTTLAHTLQNRQVAALTQAQAISGLGGIGKTQIAVEYAYRSREHYQAMFWVTAASRDALISDFVMLAALLGLPERDEQDQHLVVRAVKLWLATTNVRWLLILDNVDDLEMLAEFLPAQGIGDVLMTTRLQALGALAHGIEVEKMGEEEGITFLLRRTKMLAPGASLQQAPQQHQAQAAAIVAELDGLPLALDQAGAYIEETRCSFAAYQHLYHTRRKELLRRRGHFPAAHPESVTATWSLSFQQVEQESPAAADLLRLLAFLDPEAIPEEILSAGAAEFGPTLNLVADDALELNATIELLLRYSLIRRNPAAHSLQMHRLVQAVLRDSMERDQQRVWAERAVRGCNRAFPNVELRTWEQCRRMLPHAQMSAQHLTTYELAFPEAVRLLNQAANYLSIHARYAQAELLLQQARTLLEHLSEAQPADIATTLNNLGTLYLTQGKYQQAEPLLLQARDIREQALGREHPATATSLHNLAFLYYTQGQYQLAEPLYQQTLAIRQHVLAPEHPDIAKTGNDLALLYRSMGKYTQAEAFYRQALELQEQVLGPRHPDVAQTLYNLARLYRAQGKYTEAEPIYHQALDICVDVFGPDHPRVAQSFYGLAKLYGSQGKYAQAEELAQQALSLQEARLGSEHPEITYTLGLLAKLYRAQQQPEMAVEYNMRALRIRERTSDADHPHIALLNNNLAELYHDQGKYREAEPFIHRSLAIHMKVLGPNHPYTAYSLTNLAENFFLQQDYAQAERYFKEAIAIREQHLGLEHPRTASAYHDLARLYHAQNRYTEAEQLYQRALDIREKALGPEHPIVASSLEDYIPLLRQIGREQVANDFAVRLQHMQMLRTKAVG